MILPESTGPDWVHAKIAEFRGDPIIVEKVIRALVLLEALKVNGFEFIFKGGTALMLMIQEPRRFSIDIDIIIENKEQELEPILDLIVDTTEFIGWEENKREAMSTIEKRHFKLLYNPVTRQRTETNYILLDVVYQDSPYIQTQATAVSHFLLMEDGDAVNVTTPTMAAILGDKLTAYGPSTTGVPLSKPMEVMKQVYDIAGLFDRSDSLEGVSDNFVKAARGELIYRDLDPENHKAIIEDIIGTSHNFCAYGRLDRKMFAAMQSGVSRLNNFIYGDRFREPNAQVAVAKAAYIARKIEIGETHIDRFDREIDMSSWTIGNNDFSFLNRLKRHNLEAFYYWYLTLGG